MSDIIDLEPGDIMACYATDWPSRVISTYTSNPLAPRGLRYSPSHVAMITRHKDQPIWIESTTMCKHDCIIAADRVHGVQAHFVDYRIEDYISTGGRVVQYRLVPIDKLKNDEANLLTDIIIGHFLGRHVGYDMGHAIISGSRLASLLQFYPWYDQDQIFCSQLIAALLMRLNRLCRVNPSKFNPGILVRELVRSGTYYRHKEFNNGR